MISNYILKIHAQIMGVKGWRTWTVLVRFIYDTKYIREIMSLVPIKYRYTYMNIYIFYENHQFGQTKHPGR